MIRPITMFCWILALGAGLYLYRAKHDVELIDRHIEQIAKNTNDLRVESRRYLDDWIRLGQPEQLRKYSDQYLGLKTVAPTQFVRLGDLASRLPAPRADPPDEPAVAVNQSPGAEVPGSDTASMDEAEADDLPIPPIPPATAVLASATPPAVPLQARPVTPRPAAQPDQDTARPHAGSEARTAEEPHPLPAKPTPVKLAEPRPAAQVPVIAPAQPRGVSLSFAPGQVQAHDLAPLQAQPPASRPAEPHVADAAANDRQREIKAITPQAAEPRAHTLQTPAPQAPAPQMARQPQQQVPVAGPPQGGSMLGMSRGVTPVQLPAPVPVNASWTSPR